MYIIYIDPDIAGINMNKTMADKSMYTFPMKWDKRLKLNEQTNQNSK